MSNTKIYVLYDRNTKLFFQQIHGVSGGWYPEIEDATHFDMTETYKLVELFSELGNAFEVVGGVDMQAWQKASGNAK